MCAVTLGLNPWLLSLLLYCSAHLVPLGWKTLWCFLASLLCLEHPGVWTEMIKLLGMYVQQARMELKQPNNMRWRFFLPILFCAFQLTYMLVHDWKSDVNFELSFQFVCMNSHGFLNLAPPSSNSGYIFCCSVSTPELLVVALHQALFIVSGFCLSSFIHHLLLITFLRERNGTGWDQFLLLTALCLLHAGWFSNTYQPNICGCQLSPL